MIDPQQTSMVDSDSALKPLVSGWIGKIDRALEFKKPFQEIADEGMAFFCGPHDFMWEPRYKHKLWSKELDSAIPPAFRMTVNKVFELVALFGPVLYSRNPIRTVTPRAQFEVPQDLVIDPALTAQVQQMEQAIMANPMAAQDPMMMGQYQQLQMMYQQQQAAFFGMQQQAQVGAAQDKARADLLSMYLNYTPNELDLATNAQSAITEALVKGRGLLWCETYEPPGSTDLFIGSFYDSVDNLVIDPDAESLDDAQWIAKRCVHPHWEVERMYRWEPGSLKNKAHLESAESQGASKADDLAGTHRLAGKTNDLVVYWKVWSKMGLGARMTGAPQSLSEFSEAFGDYCYLVVSEGIPYPLNMPPSMVEMGADEEFQKAVEWPVPFWRDGKWPFSEIDFYPKPKSVWPISPIAPGLGELKFINWCMSFLANRIRTSCRDFVAVLKSAAEEIKSTFLHGGDLTIFEIESASGKLDDVIAFLKQPQVNGDIWSILSAVMEMFDKRVGLTELVYGMSSRQVRSATEASVKQEQISIRPDHMAAQVEKTLTEAARKEALAIRWLVEAPQAEPIVGATGAQWWQMLVVDADVNKVARELEVRIEAGSARKPNKDRDAANWAAIFQTLLPVLQQYALTTGDTSQINYAIAGWCESMDQESAGLMMAPMPPPMMPMQEQPSQTQEQAA